MPQTACSANKDAQPVNNWCDIGNLNLQNTTSTKSSRDLLQGLAKLYNE